MGEGFVNMPTGGAIVAGVTGWPVKHSLSPRLHGYWLAQHGIDGIYAPFPVMPGNFRSAVRGLQAAGVRGLNVTVPHKQAAFELADRVDDAARLIGAVNTLVFHADGMIEGRNTDSPGFIRNLEHYHVNPSSGPVVLFGAGGAARAAVHALLVAGAPEVRLVNRSAERAERLVEDCADGRTRYAGNVIENRLLSDAALFVNTTSAGMSGEGSIDVDLGALPDHAVVHDIVYTPLQTGLLKTAEAAGLKTVDGLGMLLHQAAPAFEAFYGTLPEVDEGLRSYLLEVL